MSGTAAPSVIEICDGVTGTVRKGGTDEGGSRGRGHLNKNREYTVFQGRAGDHNDFAIPGAKAIGEAVAERTGIPPFVVGTPEPATNVDWRQELDAALPALRELQIRLENVLASGAISVAATSRCAVSLATLPVVSRYHPSACIVWLDAHADLNTPEASISGYLGGMAIAGAAGLWESGLGSGLRLDQLVLVGTRDLDPFEADLIRQHSIPVIEPRGDFCADLRNAIGGRPVYVHFDCDVLRPGIVPTDFIVEGGLSLNDLSRLCHVMAESELVGLEIAEFQSTWAQNGEVASPSHLLDALLPLI